IANIFFALCLGLLGIGGISTTRAIAQEVQVEEGGETLPEPEEERQWYVATAAGIWRSGVWRVNVSVVRHYGTEESAGEAALDLCRSNARNCKLDRVIDSRC